jgi:glycosyltransferase involved in cell wall biosynthesis
MSIYFFEFPKTGLGISGGERCLIENVRYLSKSGHRCVVLTTDNGKEAYERFGLTENASVEYRIIHSYCQEQRMPVLFSYFLRTVQAIRLILTLHPADQDALVCNSDFFPNTIPFLICALRNKHVKLVYWWRVMAPRIFFGFEGEFTNQIHLPRLNIVHYKLNQWLYKKTILRRGIVISPTKFYETKLNRMFPNNRVVIIQKYGGADSVATSPTCVKKYDMAWVGRFQKLKGLHYLLATICLLKKGGLMPHCVVLGGGTATEVSAFHKDIKASGLESNIEVKGFVYGDDKMNYLASSRVFVMTSCFESFGQVVLEALSAGTPVVAFDLPTFNIFENGIVKVPIGNVSAFSSAVQSILLTNPKRESLAANGLEFARMYSWDHTGRELAAVITS